MQSYCMRCGRESAALSAGPDGSMLCHDCLVQSSPQNMDCRSCAERYCGGVLACPFCTGCAGAVSAEKFIESVKNPPVEPIRMDERCGRCGQTLSGRAFILHGKALCRDCLLYEQDRWEIVSAKPGKAGSGIRAVPGRRSPPDEGAWRLFKSIGIDPEKPPPDPFAAARTLGESRMPDGSCKNCEAYALGKKRGKYLGKGQGDGARKG